MSDGEVGSLLCVQDVLICDALTDVVAWTRGVELGVIRGVRNDGPVATLAWRTIHARVKRTYRVLPHGSKPAGWIESSMNVRR